MKKYPFSARKHAHDIEFARNRAFCLLHDAEGQGNAKAAEQYEAQHNKLTDLLLSVLHTQDNNGVAWLTGPEIALAKEMTAWAGNERQSKQYAE